MNPETAAQALIGVLAVLAIGLLWFGPLRWFAVDWARQEMFAARETLFDQVILGKISFDDPAYRDVRTAINANIRFAHSVTLTRILFHLLYDRSGVRVLGRTAREAASQILNTEARRTANEALDRVESASLWLVFLKSPILSAVLLAFLIVISSVPARRIDRRSARLRAKLDPFAAIIQAEAAFA